MTQKKAKIAIGADHAGFELKEILKTTFPSIDWVDMGPSNTDRVDYPDYAQLVSQSVASGEVESGVLICGSGIGMSIAANKIHGIRAAHSESEQTTKLARAHNNANVLCIGARITDTPTAKKLINAWIETPFEEGRHADRVSKISALEKNSSKEPSS